MRFSASGRTALLPRFPHAIPVTLAVSLIQKEKQQ